jgi:hypothetical protein
MLQKLEFSGANDELMKDGALTIKEEQGYTLVMTVPEHEFWKKIYESEEKQEPTCVFFVKEAEPGIYFTGLNFEHKIKQFTDFDVIGSYDRLGKDGLPKRYEQDSNMMDYFENTIECYGVADNIEQIKEKYKDQINSDAPIVISLSEMCKENQPEDGGWRWHKWGEYIGTQNPQCEYLYDEPEIDSVFVFHVYAVQPKDVLELDDKPGKKNKI